MCPYQHEEISDYKQNDKNGVQTGCEENNEIESTNDIEEYESDFDCHEFECDRCEETF